MADFIRREVRLIVELDGRAHDARRTASRAYADMVGPTRSKPRGTQPSRTFRRTRCSIPVQTRGRFWPEAQQIRIRAR
jgi:hypothetical protein